MILGRVVWGITMFSLLGFNINNFGLSMLNNGYLNVKALYKANVMGISAIPSNSTFIDISEEDEERLYQYGIDFAALAQNSEYFGEFLGGNPILTTSSGLLATVNESTKAVKMLEGSPIPTADDYLYVYYGGITLVLDLVALPTPPAA